MVELDDPQAASGWLRSRVTGRLCVDSRRVRPGDGFIAWPGARTDARRFVGAALAAGAQACLVERDGAESLGLPAGDPRIATLAALKAATGVVAAEFHHRPGERLAVVAVTGTNGKSSTAWWTAQALSALGRRCGLVGTLGIGEPGRLESTGLTTPDPVTLQAALAQMVDQGFAACAIEASSIGIAEHRLAGLPVSVAQFTNFTQDHLDYHRDMAAYWACKRALFGWPGLRAAVINVDDAQGARLAAELEGGPVELWTVSTSGPARLAASGVGYAGGGLAFELTEGRQRHDVRSTTIGEFNAGNLLLVIGALRSLGVALADAVAIVPRLGRVPGRMQRVDDASEGTADRPAVVVDYAHTPDALDKALTALRPFAASRGGRLWCVFGCGGNRDAGKRPLMGAVAQRLADAVVLTSDNPRDEEPAAIVAQILAGMAREPAPRVEVDRRAAIALALAAADASDVVLIAGKGHESTQEVSGVEHPFSDVDEARAALRRRLPGSGPC